MESILKYCILFLTLVSAFAQRTPLSVNGVIVNNPNLTNTPTLTWAVVGSNISATAGDTIWTNDNEVIKNLVGTNGANLTFTGTSQGLQIFTAKYGIYMDNTETYSQLDPEYGLDIGGVGYASAIKLDPSSADGNAFATFDSAGITHTTGNLFHFANNTTNKIWGTFDGEVHAKAFVMEGSAVKTATISGDAGLFQAYDENDVTYRTFATLQNGNTPSFTITPPSGGTVSINATTLQVGGVNVATVNGASGAMINSGTPVAGRVTIYNDTTGTNMIPSTALSTSGTNASLVGVLTANGGNFTNYLQVNGVDVLTTSGGSGFVKSLSGATTSGQIGVYSGTTGTNITTGTALTSSAQLATLVSDETGAASGSPLAVFSINPTLTGATLNGNINASAITLGDASSATFTQTYNLSGASDPVLTVANAMASWSSPVTINTGTLIDNRLLSFVSSGNSNTITSDGFTFSFKQGTASWGALDNQGTWSGSAYAMNGDTFMRRNSVAGAVKFTTSSSSTLGTLTAGTLTLTPAAADTTALTLDNNITGSGVGPAQLRRVIFNTSGIAIQNRSIVTNTASAATSKFESWETSAGGVLALVQIDGLVSSVAGFSSSVATTPIAITTTGVTNTFGKLAQALFDGVALVFTVYNGAGTAIYTNTATAGTAHAILQANGKIIITSGTGGVGTLSPL